MCTLLLVEDDADYAEALEVYLSAEGFEVASARSARQAIDLAARLRPELMLIDWMLHDDCDGIRVIEALRAIEYLPRTVMMSGLAGDDLRAEACRLGVFEVVHKPLPSESLLQLLAQARESERQTLQSPIAVLEVSHTDELLYVNSRAAQLLSRVGTRAGPARFSDLFAPEVLPDLQAAETRWVAAAPLSSSRINWHIRAQSPRISGSRLVVILDANDPHYSQEELIRLVLGHRPTARLIDGRVLVVDASAASRQLAQSMLRSAGIDCCTACEKTRALRILEQDPGIRVAVVDHDLSAADVNRLFETARQNRDDFVVIRATAPGGESEGEIGREPLLTKPWTVTELLAALDL